jgi:hypothetical protein
MARLYQSMGMKQEASGVRQDQQPEKAGKRDDLQQTEGCSGKWQTRRRLRGRTAGFAVSS